MNRVSSGVKQVEVRQRHDERGDDRAGREQEQADQPRPDEDVAPDRLSDRRAEPSVVTPVGRSRTGSACVRFSHRRSGSAARRWGWTGVRPGRGGAPPGTRWVLGRVGLVVVVEDALEGRLQRGELGVDVEPCGRAVLVVDRLERRPWTSGSPASRPDGWACRRSRASPAERSSRSSSPGTASGWCRRTLCWSAGSAGNAP